MRISWITILAFVLFIVAIKAVVRKMIKHAVFAMFMVAGTVMLLSGKAAFEKERQLVVNCEVLDLDLTDDGYYHYSGTEEDMYLVCSCNGEEKVFSMNKGEVEIKTGEKPRVELKTVRSSLGAFFGEKIYKTIFVPGEQVALQNVDIL